MNRIATIQLGKNGMSENFLTTLKTYFKNNQSVKIVVLQNFPDRDSKRMKEVSEEITKSLGENFSAKVIGFTISVKKGREKKLIPVKKLILKKKV